MTHTVSFRIELDTQAIVTAHTLATRVDIFNLDSDRFVGDDVVTWDPVFATIALDYPRVVDGGRAFAKRAAASIG